MTARPDLYVSADVEADGPVPGLYSMLSFGLSVAGSFDGTTFERTDPTAATFYRELRPITDRFEPDYLAASHLDRNLLVEHGADPVQAMTDAAQWVREAAGIRRPVLVAWPLAFDWPFLYWYFEPADWSWTAHRPSPLPSCPRAVDRVGGGRDAEEWR